MEGKNDLRLFRGKCNYEKGIKNIKIFIKDKLSHECILKTLLYILKNKILVIQFILNFCLT